MEIKVLNKTGQETGRSVVLSEAIYGIEPNDHAIYLDVKQYLAAQRQGTHKAKERAEIAGSTKKIKKQKGTGGARAGSIKSPLFRGGGRVFGPRPRNYDFKLNKKVKSLARKSALTYKAQANDILVIEDFVLDVPRTKEVIEISNKLNINDKKYVFILPDQNKNLYLSARNLKGVTVLTSSELTTYQILNASKLVVFENAVGKIEEQFNV